MRKLISVILIICSVLILANATLAKGRKGSHLVGGTGSSHKGGHYVGGNSNSSDSSSSSSSGSSRSSYRSSPHKNYSTTHHVKSLHYRHSTISSGVARDSHGRIVRSESAKHEFLKQHGYSKVPEGYEVDHIIPLYAGGTDEPSNMQLLTKTVHHAKTKADYHQYGR